MPQTARQQPAAPLATTNPPAKRQRPAVPEPESRGFGGGSGGSRSSKRKGGARRSPALSKADWGPLGKHPDLDAIVARQRLHLPLSGRLTVAQVNQAWKRCAGEHHPDRGGEHDTMQLVNGARDRLLGRDGD
jgi:hypothetical protein